MSASFRVLQITNRIPYPLNDGGNIATYNVTFYLIKAGHQVTMASLNTKKHFQDTAVLADIAEVHACTLDTSISPIGLLKGIFEQMPYNVKRFESKAFHQLLIDLLSKQTFDIIQVEGSYMALYVPTIKKYSAAKIILRSHNIEHEIWQRMAQNERNFLKKWYFNMLSSKIKTFEETSMKTFDAIVAITDRDANYYKTAGFEKKLAVINAGANLDVFVPNIEKEIPTTLCFLAGLDWMPNKQGLDWFLLEIWPVLAQKYPSLNLHIAGKAMQESYYALQNKQLVVHGLVPDAVEYLQKYEIFIVPLLSGGGMRLKVVEGMALAKCIISTSIGAEGVDYTSMHDIVIADSPTEWINQISYLIENPSKRKEIGQNAYKLSQNKYNWKNLVDTFIDVYYQVSKVVQI
jgi:glycosyltransferase involved in cell wall biosynthesis